MSASKKNVVKDQQISYNGDDDDDMDISSDGNIVNESSMKSRSTTGKIHIQIVTPGELIVKNASNALW